MERSTNGDFLWWGQVLSDFVKLLLLTIGAYIEAIFRFFVPPKLKSLTGERILITGAGGGIGRETLRLLAKSGATLICWDIDKRANDEIVEELKASGAKTYAYEVDISDRIQVEAAAAKVKKEIGSVTIIINNAAILPCHSFLGHNPKEIERIFQVNVFGQIWILREFLPTMIQSDRGHIVTVCSIAGLVSTRYMAPYCGSKHAVHGYIEGLKDELRHSADRPDIKFTTVYPFSCNTGLTSQMKCYTRFPSVLPILEPQEVAKKLVDGMRRNYEFVYVPGILSFFASYAKIALPKVQTAAGDFFDARVEPLQ